MHITLSALSSLAHEYTRSMTSIRGKRVKRLLLREFAGAGYVILVQTNNDKDIVTAAVLGLSDIGAALCASDGRGKEVSVFKWLHGAATSHEQRFDLLKDSLPLLSTHSVPLTPLLSKLGLPESAELPSPQVRILLKRVLTATVV